MSLEHSFTENGELVISLKDRLDARSAPAAQQEIDKLIAEHQGAMLIDCEDLVYVSSAGLRVFISITKLFRAQQRKFALCRPSKSVAEVFAISGFNTLFPIYQSREEALKNLA